VVPHVAAPETHQRSLKFSFFARKRLLAYGATIEPQFIRSGYFLKRIMDGTKPADLPVEQPTRIELWINMKTAQSLGLDIPATLLGRADEVIE
jgi:putative ABC transport system substrate-binding protein